jgi:hypothetical protein
MFSSSPRHVQKTGFFATPNNKPKQKEIYYEDLYGFRNEHEDDEGLPDACESEPDSDGEESRRFHKSEDYRRLFEGGYGGARTRGK